MPVILPVDIEAVWLDPGITDSRLLKDLLGPYPSELMRTSEVSPVVNSPSNDVSECMTPGYDWQRDI